MVKPALVISFCLTLAIGLSACSYRPQLLRSLHGGQVTTFAEVYPILQTNCSGCHVEGGPAAAAWSLDREPQEEKYAPCRSITDPDRRHRCTTHIQLTYGKYPLVTKRSLNKSMPFVNACDPKNSFHIGSSIPDRLSDEECNTLSNWIMQGCLDEKPEQEND